MNNPTFSYTQALGYGLKTFFSHLWLFMRYFLVVLAISLIPFALSFDYTVAKALLTSYNRLSSADQAHLGDFVGSVGIVWQIVLTVWWAWAGAALVIIAIRLYEGKKIGLWTAFTSGKLIFEYLLTEIYYGLICFAGSMLLIVPAFVWGFRYYFAPFVVVDHKENFGHSFVLSSKITYGAKLRLFGFFLLTTILTLLIYLIIGLGVFWLNLPIVILVLLGAFVYLANPVFILATVFIYKKLVEQFERTAKA